MCGFWGLALGRDVSEQPQGIRLVALFVVLTGMHECPLGEDVCIFPAAGQQLCLPEREATERLEGGLFHGRRLLHRLRQQGHGIDDPPGQAVRLPQGRGDPGEVGGEICLVTDLPGPFELGECPGQVALAEGEEAESLIGHEQAA